MTLKIAHLISDEKFPDSAFVQFDAVAPGCNEFYILQDKRPLKYLKKITPTFAGRYAYLNPRFINKLGKYDLVIVHSLNTAHREAAFRVARLKKRPVLVWVGMGFDYYDLIHGSSEELLLSETVEVFRKLHQFRSERVLSRFRKGVKALGKMALLAAPDKLSSLGSIDCFAPVLPNEYEMVERACKVEYFPDYAYWNYANNASMVDDLHGSTVDRSSNSVLLGNSASFTNNHLEAFGLLEKLGNAVDHAYTPLSYGDEQYQAFVSQAGREVLGAKFKPVSDFMSYENYMSMISSCGVVIMNHRRQQAGGNVSAMLYKGATVFLREENPLYQFYKGRGACIFSVQSLENDPSIVQHRLSDAEIMKNRIILKDFIGWDASLKKTRALVDLCS